MRWMGTRNRNRVGGGHQLHLLPPELVRSFLEYTEKSWMFQLPWSSDWWKHVLGVAASLELLGFAGTEISRRQHCTCVCGWTPAHHRGGWRREGRSWGTLRAPRQDQAGRTRLFCWGDHTLPVSLFKHPLPAPTPPHWQFSPLVYLILWGVPEDKTRYPRVPSTFRIQKPLLPWEQRWPFTLGISAAEH